MHWFLRTSERRPPAPRYFRPVLEILEDRLAPAQIGGTVGENFTNPGALPQTSVGGSPLGFVGSSFTLTMTGGAILAAGPLTTGDVGGGTGHLTEPPIVPGSYPLAHEDYGPILPTTMSGAGVIESRMVFSPDSPVTLVTPPPPPIRAVTLFAPSGGGEAAAPAGEVPEAPGGPRRGKPGAPVPGAPGTPENPQPPSGRKPGVPNTPTPNPKPPSQLNSPNEGSFQGEQGSGASAERDAAWAAFLADLSPAQMDPLDSDPMAVLLGERIPDEVLAGAGS
jgi:hypothetical protein